MELSGGTQKSYGKHVRIACLQPETEISEHEVEDSPLGRDVRTELMYRMFCNNSAISLERENCRKVLNTCPDQATEEGRNGTITMTYTRGSRYCF